MTKEKTILRYLKETVLPKEIGVTPDFEKRILSFTKEAAKCYFEGIKHYYEDYDMMLDTDMCNILIGSVKMEAAISLQIPKTLLLTNEEKLKITNYLLKIPIGNEAFRRIDSGTITQKDMQDVADLAGFTFRNRMAYHTLINFLNKMQKFDEKSMFYLFVDDRYSDKFSILQNFETVINSNIPSEIKLALYYILPYSIKIKKKTEKTELMKEITELLIADQSIQKKDKEKLLEAIIKQAEKFPKSFLKNLPGTILIRLNQHFFRETALLRYASKAYLAINSSDLEGIFDIVEGQKVGHLYEKQQVLLGFLDFIEENYTTKDETDKNIFKVVLSKATESTITMVRKRAYEILFVLQDETELNNLAKACVNDNAGDVRKTLGDVALSNFKFKNLDSKRREKLIELTHAYKEKIRLTNKQKKRLMLKTK